MGKKKIMSFTKQTLHLVFLQFHTPSCTYTCTHTLCAEVITLVYNICICTTLLPCDHLFFIRDTGLRWNISLKMSFPAKTSGNVICGKWYFWILYLKCCHITLPSILSENIFFIYAFSSSPQQTRVFPSLSFTLSGNAAVIAVNLSD